MFGKKSPHLTTESDPGQALASIVESGKGIIALASLDGKISFLNPAGCAMLGTAPDAVLTTLIFDLVPKHMQELLRQDILPMLQKGESWQGELQYRNAQTCELIDTAATIFPITDPITGIPQQIAVISLDISASKRSLEEKEKLQARMFESRKLDSIGLLAGGVAHDFNNLLGAVLGYAEMALETLSPNLPSYSDLREIRKAALRAVDLTNQLLAFARRQTITPRVLDVNQNVETLLEMLRQSVGKDIEIVWRPGKNIWPVKMDPSQIEQITTKLCMNARDAIQEKGMITIETKIAIFDKPACMEHSEIIAGDYVLLMVSDNGRGMNRETLSRLFEPFFTTKTLARGAGLGLSAVYGIVKQNKGMIHVYSEPGMGTTFKIYLPRHEAATVQLLKSDIQKPTAGKKNETVLLVEDESLLLNVTKKMLEQQGYKVLSALSPEQAIQIAKTFNGAIHLLITDVIMPEMNGKELARQIAALCPRIKCLYMSGYTDNIIVHHGVLDEGVQFLQKPFARQQLGEKIREVLDGYCPAIETSESPAN